MAQAFYRRIVHGYVEQVYDVLGNCLSQEFQPLEAQPVERRYIAPVTLDEDGNEVEAEAAEGDLEDDELIEHADDVETILEIEKVCLYDMIQPPTAKPIKPKKKNKPSA